MRFRVIAPLVVLTIVIVVVAALIKGTGADAGGDDAATVTAAQAPPANIPPGALRVAVGHTTTGRPLPAGFLGLSLEFTTLEAYAGSNPASLNPTFLQLVRNLNPNQSPSIRIGGDSTDWSWWPAPGVGKPAGAMFTITRNWLRVARAVAVALHAQLMPGIQFEADSRRVAGAEAAAMLKTIGPRYLGAFELGNEPEVYAALGWYHTSSGAPVFGRSHGYDPARFLPDYQNISSALPRTVPLAGPASGGVKWVAGAGAFADADPRVKVLTYHRYPLNHCAVSASVPAYPTIPRLLAPSSSAGLADLMTPAVRAAHARGLALRLDEVNSVACRGQKGISDRFVSALWALDTMFNFDRVGIDGVNVHTLVDSNYQPFTFTHSDGVWKAQVRPLYYGLAMFARAAPPGSRLLPVTGGPSAGPVRAWATRAPDGTVRVVLINDSRRRTVAIAPPAGGPATAALIRLTAPRLTSRTGVTIGGQSYGPSGTLQGTGHVTAVRQTAGRYVVGLPSTSAAMLTIP
jgi:hypothetical protein